MRLCRSVLIVLLAMGSGACNDLTDFTPRIAGTYEYVATGSLNRRGTLIIEDWDARTARFDGTFLYQTLSGQSVGGRLVGAFISEDRIWFRFLTEPQLTHEADFNFNAALGEVFFQGLIYESAGATFSLRLR